MDCSPPGSSVHYKYLLPDTYIELLFTLITGSISNIIIHSHNEVPSAIKMVLKNNSKDMEMYSQYVVHGGTEETSEIIQGRIP